VKRRREENSIDQGDLVGEGHRWIVASKKQPVVDGTGLNRTVLRCQIVVHHVVQENNPRKTQPIFQFVEINKNHTRPYRDEQHIKQIFGSCIRNEKSDGKESMRLARIEKCKLTIHTTQYAYQKKEAEVTSSHATRLNQRPAQNRFNGTAPAFFAAAADFCLLHRFIKGTICEAVVLSIVRT